MHTKEELQSHLNDSISLVGVNARNLDTLVGDDSLHSTLIKEIPKSIPAIAESHIKEPSRVRELKKLGYLGFLIGERFMRSSEPDRACGEFIQQASLQSAHVS